LQVEGTFNIHGMAVSKTLNALLEIKPKTMYIDAQFEFLLEEFGIDIPDVAKTKLSNSISVTLKSELSPNSYYL